jgi:hypothetical protein
MVSFLSDLNSSSNNSCSDRARARAPAEGQARSLFERDGRRQGHILTEISAMAEEVAQVQALGTHQVRYLPAVFPINRPLIQWVAGKPGVASSRVTALMVVGLANFSYLVIQRFAALACSFLPVTK